MGENVEAELKFLSQAAFIYSQKYPSLSSNLLQQFHLKSLEIGVKVIPTAYCPRCYTIYIPGANCQVSSLKSFTKKIFIGKKLQAGKLGERVYYHCKVCDTTTMHALSAKVFQPAAEEKVVDPPKEVVSSPIPVPVRAPLKPSKKAKKKKNLEQLLAKKDSEAKKPSLSLDDFLNNL